MAVVVAAALLLARLADVLMLVFGGAVLAAALRALAGVLERLGIARRASVPVAAIVVAALLGGAAWGVGDAVAPQLASIGDQLPRAWQAVSAWLERGAIGRALLDALQGLRDELDAARLAVAAGLTIGAVAKAVLLGFIGLYLALDPWLYRAGLLRLTPPSWRARMLAALDESGAALGRWLLGQGASMLFLGLASTLALSLIGAPLPLALGLITGLFAFVPIFGAVAAGVLSVLLAFGEGPRMALYVALTFVAVQQVEENLVLPLVQRWAVAMPPVLTLVAALVFGHLFGVIGVVFAAPAMVVALVFARRLLVEPMEARAP